MEEENLLYYKENLNYHTYTIKKTILLYISDEKKQIYNNNLMEDA